jgi:DNA (cytosine-5)-methyltransferase 1
MDSYNLCLTGDIGRTLSTNGTPEHMPCVIKALPEVNYNQFRASDTELATLKARGGTCGDGSESLIVAAVDCRNCTENSDTNGTLQAHMSGGSSLNLNNVVRVKYIVRRLTPLECERLQGYPDGWTDIGEWTDSKGKVHKTSDAARYKALGNSIALPPWKWVLKRLCACYERDATLASLFDGIGGFPLIWEQINGKGSCLWASEIEEFPIAVTKARIGE